MAVSGVRRVSLRSQAMGCGSSARQWSCDGALPQDRSLAGSKSGIDPGGRAVLELFIRIMPMSTAIHAMRIRGLITEISPFLPCLRC